MIALLLLCFVTNHGFLLDGSTPVPKAGTVMTDSHFSMLLNLLVEERNSREQLEKIVKQHQQETANIAEKLSNCNCNKHGENVNETNNKTSQLEDKFEVLQQKLHSLQIANAQMELKQVIAENSSRYFETSIAGLKQLQSFSDLRTVFVLQNRTTNIEKKLQQTVNTVESVVSTANARSQDFIAMLNKLKVNDNLTIQMQAEIQNTNNLLNQSVFNLNPTMQGGLNSTLKEMQNKWQVMNSSIDSLIQQMAQMSNKVVLTVRAIGGTYAAGAILPFKQVHTSLGITDLASIKNEGKFKCEKTGFYLISAFVSTTTSSGGYYYVYKNNQYIAIGFRHQQSGGLTSTVIVTEQLQVNDIVYVKNGPQMYVYDGTQSVFSIIQIE